MARVVGVRERNGAASALDVARQPLRRPDLASAEVQLAAANANVAAARAALLPSISLTGSAGLARASLHAQVDVASSRERELVLGYRKAILAALLEVENALAARSRLGREEILLEQSVQQATTALRLADVRYREGADDLIVLLDAQLASSARQR